MANGPQNDHRIGGRVRRRRKLLITAGACILIVIGLVQWTKRLPRVAVDALEEADRYELLSLDPERQSVQPTSSPSDLFHGWRVLGRVVLTDSATRHRLNDALRGGAESILSPPAMCFNPRHGIRVTRDGRTTDFLICFECEQVQVRVGDQLVADWLTDSSPQPVFDQVLQQAGVPLATRPAE
jgi:hypothetical protein